MTATKLFILPLFVFFGRWQHMEGMDDQSAAYGPGSSMADEENSEIL